MRRLTGGEATAAEGGTGWLVFNDLGTLRLFRPAKNNNQHVTRYVEVRFVPSGHLDELERYWRKS